MQRLIRAASHSRQSILTHVCVETFGLCAAPPLPLLTSLSLVMSSPAAAAPSPSSDYASRPGVTVDQMAQKQAEYMLNDHCILVDANDKPIKSASKQDCHKVIDIRKGTCLHRAFSVFLFNSQGQLMLQQRAQTKPTFPGRWTNTCCSHPLWDENGLNESEEAESRGVKKAAIRKLEDELGIKGIKPEELHFLTRVHYCGQSDGAWGEHEIDHLMFLQKDVTVNLNTDEVMATRYVTPDGLRRDFERAQTEPEHLTPWFEMIATKFLFGWWENGEMEKIIARGGLGDEELAKKITVLTLAGKPDTAIPINTPNYKPQQ